MELAYIPSPSTGVIHLGPIPLRGYAFCIIIGVFVAVWYGNKRWIARGGTAGTVADIAVWAVPFGLVGGRLYHVVTDYQLYFSEGEDWVDAFKIWEGGLGIWGAIALGAVGAWIGCRRRGIPLPAYADTIAPGIAFAQAIGRWGNWFNQELYGRPTDLPWALKITASANREAGLYHPTFLYESLWCVAVGFLVIWADRRFKLGHGRAFALYVAAYCAGRVWTEYLRVDEAHHILGLRLNVWTALGVFVLAVLYMVISSRVRPGREEVVEPRTVAKGDGPEGADAGAVKDAGGAKDGAAVKDAGGAKDADEKAVPAKAVLVKDADGETVPAKTALVKDADGKAGPEKGAGDAEPGGTDRAGARADALPADADGDAGRPGEDIGHGAGDGAGSAARG